MPAHAKWCTHKHELKGSFCFTAAQEANKILMCLDEGYLTAAVACLHNSLTGLLEKMLCVIAFASRRGLASMAISIFMFGHSEVQC